jgi:two-component system KDP operon response regulator KdpE
MTTTMIDLLLVEDDPAIRRLLRNTLTVHGYRISEATRRSEVIELARRVRPQIIVLDLGLPDGDGLDLIPELRQLTPVPIIVLSSRGDEPGKVMALDLGADDYVTKPFGIDEFMARLRASVRQRLTGSGVPPVVRTGSLEIDLVHRQVRLGGADVKLSPKEYDLLRELALHAGKVLTHRHLLRTAWGDAESVDVQYLRVYIRQLRQKIEPSPDQPRYLLTEPGVGYRLHPGDG